MRRICIVTTNRADYGRLKPVMEALRDRGDVELQIVVGSAAYFDGLLTFLRLAKPASLRHSLPWFIRARLKSLFGGLQASLQMEQLSRVILQDGFAIQARISLLLEGGTLDSMAKTAGLGLLKLPEVYERLSPDIVLINGDRFEIFPAAITAAFMNMPLAHIEGGDVSGTIDNSIRHAISKLAHIHFPATKESAGRLMLMGEHPQTVFAYGSPLIDSLKGIDRRIDNDLYERYPFDVGRIDLKQPYLLVIHHPVTTEYSDNYRQAQELLMALKASGLPLFFIAPNIDAGSDGITVAMREFRLETDPERAVFHKHVSLDDYIKLMANASVVVGNSSSLIREAAYLGTPAVVVGTRQKQRERGANVTEVPAERHAIASAIDAARDHGPYPPDLRFGDGTASVKIAEKLATIDLSTVPVQKYFWEGVTHVH